MPAGTSGWFGPLKADSFGYVAPINSRKGVYGS